MTICGYLPEVSYTHPNNTYFNILLTPDQNVTFEDNELGFLIFFSYYLVTLII